MTEKVAVPIGVRNVSVQRWTEVQTMAVAVPIGVRNVSVVAKNNGYSVSCCPHRGKKCFSKIAQKIMK